MDHDILLALNGGFITESKYKINNLLYIDTATNESNPNLAVWQWYNGETRLPSPENAGLSFSGKISGRSCIPGEVIKTYDWVPLRSLMYPFIYTIPIIGKKIETVTLSKLNPNYREESPSKIYWHLFCYMKGHYITKENMILKMANSLGITRGDSPADALNYWYTKEIRLKSPLKDSILRKKTIKEKARNYDWFPYMDVAQGEFYLIRAAVPDLIPVPISVLILKAGRQEGRIVYEKAPNLESMPKLNEELSDFLKDNST